MDHSESTQISSVMDNIKPDLNNAKLEAFQYLAHDMKAPLHSILGFTDNIKRKLKAGMGNCTISERSGLDGILRDLDIITEETEKLSNIVNSALDYSGFLNCDISLNRTHFSVNEFMKEISEFIHPLICRKEVTCTMDIQKGMPLIFADRSRLSQAMKNLATNAVKFTQKGKISICAEFNEGVFHFSVVDTGCGIPREEKEIVFRKFYRVQSGNGLNGNGNGLGLAICKSIIELHNGKIWNESAIPQGTIFHFTIPGENGMDILER